MSVVGNPPQVFGAGEYGATTVHVTKDGVCVRLAFGRNDINGTKSFHGAVILSPEASVELAEQLKELL